MRYCSGCGHSEAEGCGCPQNPFDDYEGAKETIDRLKAELEKYVDTVAKDVATIRRLEAELAAALEKDAQLRDDRLYVMIERDKSVAELSAARAAFKESNLRRMRLDEELAAAREKIAQLAAEGNAKADLLKEYRLELAKLRALCAEAAGYIDQEGEAERSMIARLKAAAEGEK